jgi:methylamine utilization protein MauE
MGGMAVLTFCRWAIGLTFAVSAAGKAASPRSFRDALADLGIGPASRRRPIALATVGAEGLVTVLVAAGGRLAEAGFALALVLLAVFSAVLVRALRARTEVSCNCFGASERQISPYDVVRNAVLAGCCAAGEWAGLVSSHRYPPPALIAALGLMAVALVLIATNLQAITELLRRPQVFE